VRARAGKAGGEAGVGPWAEESWARVWPEKRKAGAGEAGWANSARQAAVGATPRCLPRTGGAGPFGLFF
jgi:hypothetical protein